MNLGDVYLRTFFNLSFGAILLAAAIVAAFYLWKRIHRSWLTLGFIGLSFGLVVCGNSLFHQSLFKTRHLRQNRWVPANGCLTYEPSFARLYATYSMSREEFEAWIKSHPWELFPFSIETAAFDAMKFERSDFECAYATKMADNGSQLRVYFVNGTMFLSYNVM